jgi:hypothetical protein
MTASETRRPTIQLTKPKNGSSDGAQTPRSTKPTPKPNASVLTVECAWCGGTGHEPVDPHDRRQGTITCRRCGGVGDLTPPRAAP